MDEIKEEVKDEKPKRNEVPTKEIVNKVFTFCEYLANTKLFPYQLGGRCRTVRLHPLLQRQHPRQQHSGDPAEPAVHGLPQRPALQQEPSAPLPHAGKPRAAAQDGPRDRRPQHRPPEPGKRRSSVRQVQVLCRQLAADRRRDLVPHQDPREPLREL